MTISLKTKFTAIGLLSTLLVAFFVMVSSESNTQKLGQIKSMRVIAEITQRHMESDMMHDAMRADVYRAILAMKEGNGKDLKEAKDNLKEHYDTFKENLSANQKEDLPTDIRKLFDSTLVGVESYYAAANAVMDDQGGNIEVLTAAFIKNFEALEESMGSISDDIAAWGAKEEKASVIRSTAMEKKVLLIASITILLSILVPVYAYFGVFHPQGKIVKVMHALAQGNFKIKLKSTKRRDEIGEMTHSLAKLREAYTDFSSQISAIGKAQAVISFKMDGTIIDANQNFLSTTGYSLDEIKGKHHSMFTDAGYASSQAYKSFWEKLNRGEFDTGEYRRLGKGGKEIWIQASYNPIIDADGKPFKVVKFATDITQEKLKNADYSGQIEAIGKAQAVISFNMDGTILDANQNFLSTMGYKLDEIKGKHHSMFADATYASSHEYKSFWEKLNRGEFDAGEYKRIGKGGKEVWIQASYNPIVDANGKPFKVVKYATETTQTKLKNADFSGQIEAIGKAQAVIEFDMTGVIQTANENFLKTMGYSLDEIKGKHHRMFADPKFAASSEYKDFWVKLNRGEYQAGEFKRVGKGGKEIWIQASYNPILDLNGKPFKVVKYATDVTQMVLSRTENEKGMNEAVAVLKEVASGNLTNKMVYNYQGTFADIKKALNTTIDRLKETVVKMKNAAESVNSASTEISAGGQDLSARTEQQASSLEETAASMEQLTGAVRQNTENSNNANKLATEAKTVAEKGGAVVNDTIAAMNGIEKSSQKIADIINVIDEIAFQTNLLALNAAVEAARAGDAGKGFAVVASEVRSLAGRSASASKDIKTLITESVTQVKTGSSLVNEAGTQLKEIVRSVEEVAGMISEIASASSQQASGIDEINTSITQMDEMTQQNAALVEENTAASQLLVEQAAELEKLVQFFTIEDGNSDAEPENDNTKVANVSTAVSVQKAG